MTKQIFVNLPVKDLKKSIDFFTQIGYTFNPKFSDDTGTCMIISDTIFVMLLTEAKFKEFTKKQLADAHKTTEIIIALNADNKDAVDEIVNKAITAGGTTYAEPTTHGDWMYQRSFADLDGHQWEYFFMDESKFPQQ